RSGGDPATPDPQPATPAPAVGVDATLELAGRGEAGRATGQARLRREDAGARVELDGRGDRGQLRLQSLRAQMPGGTLDATGVLAWPPALAWELQARLA